MNLLASLRRVLFFACGWGVTTSFAAIPLPQINTNNVIVVTNAPYGAVGDDFTTNTTAIQNAINAAARGGQINGLSGGVVEIPASAQTYLCGPLTLANYVDLQIDAGATLQLLPYGSYPGGTSPTDFISASKLHDIEVSGPGTLDGQGAAWWAAYNSSGISRPKAMIAPSTCTNVLIASLALQNPPNTHISFRNVCLNVTVNGISINTTNPSPNTDGIDCSAANVLIANSHITDGDDHIALGDGSAGHFNHDITITNCLFGNGHGVSIGSYTTGGLSNLLVINCVWTNGSSGIHLKADNGRGGLVQKLSYINLAMTNTQIPIFFYSYYTNSGTSSGASVAAAAAYPSNTVSGTTPIWRDIIVSNLTAVPGSGSPVGIIWGKPELCISNVLLEQINMSGSKYFQLYNARGVQLINSQITAPTTNAFALYNAQLIISNQSPVATPVRLEGISTNGYVNSLSLYGAQAAISHTNMLLGTTGITLGGGVLTISNSLAQAPTDLYTYVLGSNASSVVVKDNLSLAGTNDIVAGGGFTNGIYTLMTYTGSLNGNLPVLGSVPAGFSYLLQTNIPGQVNLSVTAPPAIPAGLTAVGTNLAVILGWQPAQNATSYNLKRATVSGGPYTVTINLAATNYLDQAVSPGSLYYYVVTATNTAGESGHSLEASAAPLPSFVPTNIVSQMVDGALQLSWPPDHLGWELQVQTNTLQSNWSTWPGSAQIRQTNIPIDPQNGSVFFRLVYP